MVYSNFDHLDLNFGRSVSLDFHFGRFETVYLNSDSVDYRIDHFDPLEMHFEMEYLNFDSFES